MTSPLDRLRAALTTADQNRTPFTGLHTNDLAWAVRQLDKEQAMNDNDVDDLARVLAEHWKNPSEFTHAFCHVMAEAVLASGVVVSARDVQALIDVWADTASTMRKCEDYALAGMFEQFAGQLRSLLREPATDAAPTGETPYEDTSAGVTLDDVAKHYAANIKALREALSGDRSAADATEPADPHPSDPQPTTGPQEDA